MRQKVLSPFKIKTIVLSDTEGSSNRLIKVLWAILVFTVFSGAIRKWLLGVGVLGNALLLLQLFLPWLFYWLVIKNTLPKQNKSPTFWAVYLVYVVLTALNPMNHSIYHGVFGLMLHTGYWLIWLAYIQKGKWMELERLIPILMVVLVVEFVLASLQYALPGTHILNVYASGDATNAIVGNATRVSGTFSYLGGFQVLLPLFACLAWLMMLRRYATGLVLIVLGMGFTMALMSGSRGAVGFFALYSAMAFLLSGNIGSRIFKVVVQGTLLAILVTTLIPSVQNLVQKSYDNFMYRVENSDEIDERIAGSFGEILKFRGNYPVFGVGLGATYQGANALFGTSKYVQEYGGYESEPARIILEGGYVLFFLRLILLITFLRSTRYLPWLAKAFFFVVFFNSMVTFNVYQGVFFVLGIMLVDRGYYLKKREKRFQYFLNQTPT